MTEDTYREYCRCWAIYLGYVSLQTLWRPHTRAFFAALERRVSSVESVQRWPGTWPEVCLLFCAPPTYDAAEGTAAFVEAVRYAEATASDA